MADIKLNLDVSGLAQYLENFAQEVAKDVQKGVEGLAKSTHAHIKQEAQNGLHSFRAAYLENLSPPEQIGDFIWVITLNSDANWIEEGRPEFDMKPGLLNPKKTGKGGGVVKEVKNGKNKGAKYRVVPMNQAKAPTEMSPETAGYEQNMVNKVRAELKKKGVPYRKLELDKNGSPRTGKLHTFNFSSPTPGKGNTPQLSGVNIYQTKQKDGSTKRTITTFRTVMSQGQEGKWIHPPVEALDLFGDGEMFAEQEWATKLFPAIMEKYRGG